MNHRTAQPCLAIITMTEQHRAQWLRMINQLQAAQAPADQIEFCRTQLAKVPTALLQLRSDQRP